MKNNHVKKMVSFIESSINVFGECMLTHKDILQQTNANCCYSILRALKKYYDITYEVIKEENCTYRRYTLKRKEEGNAEKANIWRACENVQLPLIQLGKNPC